MSSWFHRVFGLFCRRKLDAEMAEEMRAHIELQAERNCAAGMNGEDAFAAAKRQFGGVAQIQERARDGWRFMWFENVIRDFGFALRSLRKNPGFTCVIVFTLALGLGVNTALFTWFNAAAFRPLPVLQPEQLVRLVHLTEKGSESREFSYRDFVTYREHQDVLSDLAACAGAGVELLDTAEFNPATGEKATGLQLETVSANFFTVFDVPMARGRPLVDADETTTDAQPVIVLSHYFWQNHFGGDPDIVGRTLRVRGLTRETLTIVGVAGPDFHGTKPGALAGWVPLLLRRGDAWQTDLNATMLTLTGRLRPSIPREQAAEALRVIANAHLVRPGSAQITGETISLEGAATYINISPQMLSVLLPMVGVFGAVLLIACANASNLMLARTVTRQFEFAVRSALGAGRRRLFTLLMTECVILGVLGGLAAWGVSACLLRFAWPRVIDMVPGAREGMAGLHLHADHRVFIFTLVTSLLSGIIGGLWPALRVSHRNVASALSHEGSVFGRKVRVSRVRSLLVITQLALGSALVFTAGLLVHRALETQFADLGFDTSRLLTLVVQAPRTIEEGQLDAARQQVEERVRSLRDVEAVCAMPRFPFARAAATVWMPDSGATDARAIGVLQTSVASDNFSTLELPVVRGRSFGAGESPGDRVVMISESAARAFWPDDDALGRQLEIPASVLTERDASRMRTRTDVDADRVSVTVVGVVRDTRVYDPWSEFRLMVYLPLPALNRPASHLLIRTRTPIEQILPALQTIGRDATGIIPRIETVEDQFAVVFIQYRVLAMVAGILAVLALIVAVIGLYGMMSFAVNQRVKEIGIRMALGASPGRVASGVVRDSLRLVTAGAILGYLLSVFIALVARTLLFGVSAFDPVACGVVTLLLAALGVLACWSPARQASRVDPNVALRAE